mgnify:CR=1 FL=1
MTLKLRRYKIHYLLQWVQKYRINHTAKKGKIEIEYYGNEDLERVLGFLIIKENENEY